MPLNRNVTTPEEVLQAMVDYQDSVAAGSAHSKAERPGNRVPFLWPPHPVSAEYHVLASDWTGSATTDIQGETFEVKIARTPHGVFGKIDRLWVEARGDSEAEMLKQLAKACEPLFHRQWTISNTLGLDHRFSGHIHDLSPIGLTRLLYCPDRDVAHDAQVEIESNASLKVFGPALVAILLDDRHPIRRSAQWCVLDMFEDLPSFFQDEAGAQSAIDAIRQLMWNAEDDFARTVYKAGVVLGGHICSEPAAQALLDCLNAPSKIGRRSAMHAVFHLAEWMPEKRELIVSLLQECAKHDAEPLLREFAGRMAQDIASCANEHTLEPVFSDELLTVARPS